MPQNKSLYLLFIFCLLLCILSIQPAVASVAFDPAKNNSDLLPISKLNLGTESPLVVIMDITYWLATLLGFAFFILIIYAGFIWMTARGNEEEIKKAQTILKRAMIGLVIVLMSVSIAYLIYWLISSASTQEMESGSILKGDNQSFQDGIQ